jgi:NAD(P)-dependent dehydrogenase (short-subunit alcohol dehydrogenase family)
MNGVAKGISLSGRRALVTGGSRGLGRQVAHALADAGALVSIVGRDLDALSESCTTAPGGEAPISAIRADLGDLGGAQAVVDQALAVAETWHIVVNCAGVAATEPIGRIDPADWRRTFAVNVDAPFILCQGLAGSLVKSGAGRIVNVSSHSGRRPQHGSCSYSASKAALQMLTLSLAVELGPHQVTANAICPTVFMSEMGQRLWSDPEVAATKTDQIPAKRFGNITEITDLILFLVSDHAAFVNGSIIGIDGGLFAGRPASGHTRWPGCGIG